MAKKKVTKQIYEWFDNHLKELEPYEERDWENTKALIVFLIVLTIAVVIINAVGLFFDGLTLECK